VLAGVHSWDDSSLDELLPRPLMPVAYTPLICHVLGWLRNASIARATICANSASLPMRQTLADGAALGIDLDYYEDWAPRGPAGCIRDAASEVPAERVVATDGTILPECDLGAVLEGHGRSGAAMTIVATRDPDTSNGARERLIPAGIYVLDHAVLKHVPQTGYQDIKEVLLPRLHKQGVRVRTHVLPAPCPRITDAESYLMLNARALERLLHESRALSGYRRMGQAMVHESVRIPSPDALVGTLLIGPGTTIAPDATLVGPATIGAECVIESGAVVCGSVLWDGCRVGRGAAVNHCVLADGGYVEAEAILFHAVSAAEPSRRHRLGFTSRLESWLFPPLPDADRRRPPKGGDVGPARKLPDGSSASAPAHVATL